MNKWKIAFWIMAGMTILNYALLLPPILGDKPPNVYYMDLFKTAELWNMPVGVSVDYSVDSDGDGLSDYDEDQKYRTHKNNADSDGDGIPDGDWDERREYTRTYRAVVDLRPPYSLMDMNDFYQDARLLERLSPELERFEVILYPEAREKISPGPYTPRENEYTRPTFAKNYDDPMGQEIRSLTARSQTDLQALMILQREFNTLSYEDLNRDLGYSSSMPLQFQYFTNGFDGSAGSSGSAGSGSYSKYFFGIPSRYSMEELLEHQFFAKGMFTQKTRGACSSSATIRGALFRAAGLEEQTVYTIPLFYSLKSDNTVVDVATLPWDHELFQDRETASLSDHFFNVVMIGGRWIRVDTNIIDTGVHKPYIKLMNLHDQGEVSWEYWNPQRYWKERPYVYRVIEEEIGRNRKKSI